MNSLKHLALSVTMFVGACTGFATVPVMAFNWGWEGNRASQEAPQYTDGSLSTETSPEPSYEPTEAPSYTQKDVGCMAEAIYFEARGESIAGQTAVGLVILKRAKSGRYPTSVCNVISQNDHKPNKCMFSYRCDGKSEYIQKENNIAYNLALSVSECVLSGECSLVGVEQATMYYACDGENRISRPDWNFNKLRIMGKIENHCFYREV